MSELELIAAVWWTFSSSDFDVTLSKLHTPRTFSHRTCMLILLFPFDLGEICWIIFNSFLWVISHIDQWMLQCQAFLTELYREFFTSFANVYECYRGFHYACSTEHSWDRVTAASDAVWRRTSSISTSRRHLLILHRRASTSELQRSSRFVLFTPLWTFSCRQISKCT